MRTIRAIPAAALTAVVAAVLLAACSSSGPAAPSSPATPSASSSTADPGAPSSSAVAAPPSTHARVTRPPAQPTDTDRIGPPPTAQRNSTTPASSTSSAAILGTLPLQYSTGSADQVITVVAPSHSSTTAILRTWQRSSGHWTQVGPQVSAWLGSDGIGHASEDSTATPSGSFTITQAFGREADPGTALPYRQTTPADWWISQPGALYNTEQRCASDCPFTQGDPNEHLYYETPFYEYAVVIDYNTRNAGPVVPGAGSAFFLHVTVGQPTEGCVSIDRDQLVRILRWLRPSAHPRILMGVG